MAEGLDRDMAGYNGTESHSQAGRGRVVDRGKCSRNRWQIEQDEKGEREQTDRDGIKREKSICLGISEMVGKDKKGIDGGE